MLEAPDVTPISHSQDLQALTDRLAHEVSGRRDAISFNLVQLQEVISRVWMMGAAVALNTVQGVRTCRICGCCELQACPERCAWVAQDLCSTCVPVRGHQLAAIGCGGCGRPAGARHTCQEC